MFKKFLFSAVAVLAVLGMGITAMAYYEPYILSYSDTHNNRGYRRTIQSGWSFDNRGGDFKVTTGGDFNTINDVSSIRGTQLYRDINRTDEGVVTLETMFKIRHGCDGFSLVFTDDNRDTVYSLETKDGYFYVLGKNTNTRLCEVPSTAASTYIHVRIKLDFENSQSTTTINGVDYRPRPLLSDNIVRFAYKTSPEDTITVSLFGPTKITANYYVYEDFKFSYSSTPEVPYGWTSTNATDAYVKLSEGYVKNSAVFSNKFDSVGGKVAFEGIFIPDPAATGSFSLLSGGKTAVDFSFDTTNFTAGTTVVYSDYYKDMWYRFRVEADFDKHTADIKVNGRIVKTISISSDITSVDSVSITASGEGMRFDNIKLFSLVEHSDYVPEPVLPTKDNYTVGINVCPLWAYNSSHTWQDVSPYDEFRSVLGYYDEGNPEVADWEIKMLAEHGVDFQAFCWYADNSNGPLRPESIHLHDGYMNAKYSDKIKYALIWENVAGAQPDTLDNFYNYYVPYWIENYFKDDRYMTIDGKIVLFSYGWDKKIHHELCGQDFAKSKAVFEKMRQIVKEATGKDMLFLTVGVSPCDSVYSELVGIDGAAAYHWGGDGYSWEYTKTKIRESAALSENANKSDGYTWTIPTISTGFNHLPWSEGDRHPNMSVSDFKTGLTWMRDTYFDLYPPKYKWQENFVMLSNWNEYGEGTYIMPCEDLNGFGYLEAVRQVFTSGSNANTHTDYTLTQSQLDRIGKNYPQHIRLLRPTHLETNALCRYIDYCLVFDGKEHFAVGNATDKTYDGAAGGISENSRAYVETRDTLNWDLSKTEYLAITLTTSDAGTAELYYTTRNNPIYVKDRYLSFDVSAGTNEYIIPVLEKDIVDMIRILPADDANVSFAVKKIEAIRFPALTIDDKEIVFDHIMPEIVGGTEFYFPFNSLDSHQERLAVHYEWDRENGIITFYGDTTDTGVEKFAKFTAGSDKVETHTGTKLLPFATYLVDGLPMIHIKTFCDIFGYEFVQDGPKVSVETVMYDRNSYANIRKANEWNFTHKTTSGWSGNQFIDIESGVFHVNVLSSDPMFSVSGLEFEASDYSEIEVKMMYSGLLSDEEVMTIFFQRTDDASMASARSVSTPVPGKSSQGEYVTFTLDLSANENWNGTIKSLRIDPIQYHGGELWIEYIKLVGNDEETQTPPVETPDVSDKTFKDTQIFTSVTLDAEDGLVPFVMGNSIVTVIDDPANGQSDKAYMITPKTSGLAWIGFNYPMCFEAGATYKVSYNVMAGAIGSDTSTKVSCAIYPDAQYDDYRQYGIANSNDHLPSPDGDVYDIATPTTNTTDTWTYYDWEFTVDKDSFIRSSDAFRIYANPVNNSGITFYIDDLVIEKVDTDAKIVSATINTSGMVTVTGTTGAPRPANKNIYVAIYDKNGKFLGMKFADCTESADFLVTFSNASTATQVRVFTWSGLSMFRPMTNYDTARITRE